MTATVFGATGLVGNLLLHQLSNDTRFTNVNAVVRRSGSIDIPKIHEVVVDYSRLADYTDELKADIFFNCLGTTIREAGSQQAQQQVDRDYPISIAAIAENSGVKKMISVSSVGANAASTNFYLRTKGEMENGVMLHMREKAVFVRPSMIEGNRKKSRALEVITLPLMKFLNLFFRGKASRYRSIHANTIAKSMVNASFINTPQVMHYMEMKELVLRETSHD